MQGLRFSKILDVFPSVFTDAMNVSLIPANSCILSLYRSILLALTLVFIIKVKIYYKSGTEAPYQCHKTWHVRLKGQVDAVCGPGCLSTVAMATAGPRL